MFIMSWSGLLAATAVWPSIPSQAQHTERSSPTSERTAGAEEWSTDASVHSTAEDVLAALQKLRPRNEPIAPASRALRGAVHARAKLWPEGARIVGRPGQLVPAEDWWTFTLDGEAEVAPLKLLPNATLEAMVRTDAAGERRYELSGELTVFNGENYLLPRFAARSAGKPAAPAVQDEPIAQPEHERAVGVKDTAAVRTGGAAAVATDASAEDVLAVLAAQEPGTAMIAATRPDPATDDLRSPGTGYPTVMDGTPLVRRPGRVVPDGRWWTFLVESEHSDSPDAPLRLLPNQNMELMVQAAKADSTGVVFIVSGEVLAYGGDNYLLARAVLRRSDLGNLRK